jgi:phosphoribosyl 1,2-cyclic phosphate phosphodiesterase
MFLGTAASEGFPDAFCDCQNCTRARELGGKSLRLRSSALVDDVLLIDLGPDLMAQALIHGISLARIEHCIQTHEHADHLDHTNFLHRSQYCGVHGNPRLHYWATRGALAVTAAGFGPRRAPNGLPDPEVEEKLNIAVHEIEPFRRYEVGPYRVSTVKGFHDPEKLTPLLHVIERDGRSLFYATDTGEIPEESWQALKAGGHRFDVVAMDHTFGFQGRVNGHMNAEQFLEQVERMRAEGMLNDGARIFAHHVAHHSHPPHEELLAWTSARGYEVAYDGLVVEI